MAQLHIITRENPNLRRKASRVRRVDDSVRKLMDDMTETMIANNGVGLAATQVDVHIRVIVVRVEGQLYQLANPELVRSEGEQTGYEGCLSVPGLVGEVTRSERVVARGLNRHGKEIRVKGSDLLARAIQHEIDHLDGVLFTDKVNPGTLREVHAGDAEAEEEQVEVLA